MIPAGVAAVVFFVLCSENVSGFLTVEPLDAEVLVGDSTRLNCSTHSVSKGGIHWSHYPVGKLLGSPPNYVYAWNELEEPYRSRFEVHRVDTTGSVDLVIQRATPGDAGIYVCRDEAGAGNYSLAQLIVLVKNISIQSNMAPDGLIGDNSCGIEPEELELSCAVEYSGNVPPVLEWRKLDDNSVVTGGVTRSNFTNGIRVNLTLKGRVALHGLSYVCQTTRSRKTEQYNSTSPVIRILYAIENTTQTDRTAKDEVVVCSANTSSSQSCSYRWIRDQGKQVSSDRWLRTSQPGVYDCRAVCWLGRHPVPCEIVAMRIYVSGGGHSQRSENSTLSPPSVTTSMEAGSGSLLPLVSVAGVVFIVSAVVLFVVFFWKHNKRTKKRQVERDRLFFVERPAKIPYKDKPTKIREVFIEGQSSNIRGITLLDLNIFVVRARSSDVHVYNSTTFAVEQRPFDLPGLVDPWDVVSCPLNSCLYVMDGKGSSASNREIVKVNAREREVTKDWTTKKDAGYLSVSDKGNVILAIYKKNKLKEYSPEGVTLRTVTITSGGGRIHPHHAIQLTTGDFLVIHGIGDSLHRACIVNEDGLLIKAFGGKKGSDEGHMNLPKYLVVDRAGSVMVLDQNNSRVLLLNAFDLEFQRELISQENGPLVNPCRIHLDEMNRRLFVSQGDSFLVFDVRQPPSMPLMPLMSSMPSAIYSAEDERVHLQIDS